jgi:DNA-binding NtrC family response regulator
MSIGVALVIGDERTLSPDQEESLADAGIAVSHSADVPRTAHVQAPAGFDVVLADLPESYPEAADRVDRLHSLAIEVPLILLTDELHLSDAYAMAGEAAFDCLPRSVTGTWLTHKVHQALEQTRWKRNAGGLLLAGTGSAVLAGVKHSATFAGRGPASDRVRREISEAARSNMPVMIHGETGTGKDVVARLIHEAMRASRPGAFVKVSCPALPDAMLEDELFGHAASAAAERRARPGRLELASRGTLLLDEISEMSPSAQARLLEVLEPESGAEAGSPGAGGWDLRLIAATSMPPERLYTAGGFRHDLYFRLNGYTIELPPLRERPEDISVLAEFFLTKYAPLTGGRVALLPPHALGRMTQYGWPGNVRELEVAIKRYVVSGDERALTSTFVSAEQPLDEAGAGDRYHESERRVILSALSETRWNRRKAAKLLGISYNTLRRRIERYNLDTRAAN